MSSHAGTKVSNTSPGPSAESGRAGATFLRNSRLVWLLILLLVATFFTWFYPFHQDANANERSLWTCISFPKERNAFLRAEKGDEFRQLYSLFYEPLSRTLWAGVTQGKLYSSRDEGKTWLSHHPVSITVKNGKSQTQFAPPIKEIHFLNGSNGWVQTLEHFMSGPDPDLSSHVSHVFRTTNAGRDLGCRRCRAAVGSGASFRAKLSLLGKWRRLGPFRRCCATNHERWAKLEQSIS
jgi:hypothetical protein